MNQHKQSEDFNLGRGWLNRAAEMLDSCEDHVSDAEFARAAAAIGAGFIQLAAAEREAAAQAFVDDRHAAERAEDLERLAANRTEDLERIGAADAKAWKHQDAEAEVRTAVIEAHRAMTARMQAEQAEIAQRTEALAALDVAGLSAAGQRQARAEAEARPHDDEPEAPPFLGFTRDGHPVGGPVPDDVPRPALVARCGGPMACGACMDDAGDLRRAAREAGRG